MADDGNTASATRSKQERIRDNQRRSRARRQEYLTDLERRLSECHVTCREADLQRDSYTQLQRENTLLRQLLVYAGVSPGLIESYVTQGMTPAPQECASSLRRIKPKMSAVENETSTRGPSDNSTQPYPAESQSCKESSLLTSTAQLSSSSMSAANCTPPRHSINSAETKFDDYLNYSPSADFMTSASSAIPLPATSAEAHMGNHDWLFSQQPGEIPLAQNFTPVSHQASHSASPALDTEFGVPENMVLYSVAKGLIDRYSVTGGEMEDIKARIQPNPSASPLSAAGQFDQDYDFNQRMLFEVANELSRKYN